MRDRLVQLLPWLVLVVALAVTGWDWREATATNERVRRLQFERLSHQATAAIVDRIDSYSDAHYGGAALFRHSRVVTRDEWREFVDSLELERRHPGVGGVGHIAVVAEEDLAGFEALVRMTAYPEYRVRFAGHRERYYPIRFIEPLEGNTAVLGLDMASEAGPREAMERARDEGRAALSQRMILIQDVRQPAGFMIYLPLYGSERFPPTIEARRERITGWIYAPFVAQDFIDGIFASTLQGIRSHVSLSVYAGDSEVEAELLYRDTSAVEGAKEAAGGLRTVERLSLLGQTWTVVGLPGADFADFVPPRNAPRVLAGGLVISVALFALVHALTRTRSRALALARGMTRELEARTRELESSNRELAVAVEAAEGAADALLEQHATLARADRMAAVGEMAGSLAHEIRNPLAGIQMSLENLRNDVEDPEIRERIELPIGELGRLARLLNRTLSPLRHAPESVTSVPLRALVEELCGLLRYRLPANLSLEVAIPDDIEWPLPKDRIRQSLLNLVLNAIRAMGDTPGNITISAEITAGGLAICVDDDGPGFPEELLAGPLRRFDSRTADGTGLGLAVVRRVAEDLGGRLLLENRVPHGARARLELPAAAAGAESR